MPENTPDEIKAKLRETRKAKDKCVDTINKLRSLQPDQSDKVLSAIANFTGVSVEILGALRTIEKKALGHAKLLSTKGIVSAAIALIGYKQLANLIKKGTIKSSEKFISELNEMIDNNYIIVLVGLTNKQIKKLPNVYHL